VTKVVFAIDGRRVASVAHGPYVAVVRTRKLARGAHTITATAFDAAGRRATSSIVVSIGSSGALVASSAKASRRAPKSHRVTAARSARRRPALHVLPLA
jgi:hypothetical protein